MTSREAAVNFDRRISIIQATGAARATASAAQSTALSALSSALSDSLLSSIDAQTGVTRSLYNPKGFLTEAAQGAPLQIADGYLRANLTLLGLDSADLDDYEVTDSVYSAVSGVTHIYLRQRHQGLPVYNGQLQVHIARDGRISGINNAFVPGLARLAKSAVPVMTAEDAVMSAAVHLKRPMLRRPQLLAPAEGAAQTTSMNAATLSRETVEAELMWLPVGADLQLVWRFQLHMPDSQHIYDITVDAEGGKLADTAGERVMTRFTWSSSAKFLVYEQPAESPNHISPLPPDDARTLVVDPEDATASPSGWFDSGQTDMDGNNVRAYTDRDGNNSPDSGQPNCTAALECDFPLNLGADPVNYKSAAIANLFYWNNIIHDIQHQYGFDEAGGNFQESNFGRGGLGSDSVNAEAQDNADGNSRCNANMATPPDGSNPRMQMYVCNYSNPQADGDLDNGVIVHEYGHGITIRQVGGPSNSSCLNNNQQPGEGWSDWLALAYTAKVGDAGTDSRGIGTYLFGQPPNGGGIRPQPYSTDPAVNDYTYASINGLSVPHGLGSVWAQVLWEVYWALVDKHGFDPDLYNALGGSGNQRAMLYVNEGLKNTACSPTFVETRDGIIQAANGFSGGEDVCLLWETFAAFGLGTDAVSGGSNSTSPINGFALPAECTGPTPPPPGCKAVLYETDFESGTAGWEDGSGLSTCTTGSWVVGDPNRITSGGVVTQLGDDNTPTGVNALFTQPNTSAGRDDVDGGVCSVESPVIDATGLTNVLVELYFFHGQRDAGDHPGGDFFSIDAETAAPEAFETNLVSIGDVTSNAAWTKVTTTLANPGTIQLRVQASDGAGPGDLVEGGIDDVRICEAE
ncbi:MAG: M36 family metallopeptidase [Kiloniellales bacterium]|nr:M36 family metallopeptidase [Kiloniellales bacterium]